MKSRGVTLTSPKGNKKVWVVSDHLYNSAVRAMASFLSLNRGRVPKNRQKPVTSTRSSPQNGRRIHHSARLAMLRAIS
ncbi:conserved hypothetical protein [Ricinus communis]|uniref:Uncharacterized protein n=1 Tax=Ricinus communis TaxID=3988 RepID=B9RPW7_RICCO|nr:conserved hypothetical protein [Ricinus communis]